MNLLMNPRKVEREDVILVPTPAAHTGRAALAPRKASQSPSRLPGFAIPGDSCVATTNESNLDAHPSLWRGKDEDCWGQGLYLLTGHTTHITRQ